MFGKNSLIFLLQVLLAIVLLNTMAIASVFHTTKPQSPIKVQIEPVTKPVVDVAVEFTVTVTSVVVVDSLELSVNLPDSVVLNSGEIEWNGKIEAGGTKQITFISTFLQSQNQGIVANATVITSTGAQFAAQAAYQLPTPSISVRSFNINKSIRQGQNIVEYSLD